jgi:glycosyltransferase involved in cell wall biosynthesis
VKLRVLHCIYDDPRNPWVAGGGAVRVFELYRRLAEQIDVTVATGNYPGARDEVVENVRYVRLGAASPYAWSRWTYARAATRMLAKSQYDAAVFDFSVYTPLRLPRDRPVGVTVHHVTGPTARERWGPVLGGMLAAHERRMLRSARWISATSAATYEQLRALLPERAHIVRVGAGVPDDLFSLPRREQDYLLYFGRLDWFQKGLDVLLDATARLVRGHPALQLRIAGRGKDAARVNEAARRLGLGEHVQLLGPVSEDERRALFSGARVLLMPSRFEGFGMVAAEAMAAGVPVVAAAAGSLPEVVAPPEGGVLVPREDPDALAAAAERLLADGDARAALSHSARRSAERFRWDAVARDHLDFLRRIHQDGDTPSIDA